MVCPGEKIDQDSIDYIKLLKAQRCNFQGTLDPNVDTVRVLGLA